MAASSNDSDHCPSTLDFMEDRPDEPVIEKYNIKATFWNLYEASDAWNGIPMEVHNIDCASLLDDLYKRCCEAASTSIPNITIIFFPKPYWIAELTQSRRNREFLYGR